MRYAAATDNKKLPLSLSIVLGLLAFSVFNYIDRGNLSIAAPMLKDELGLSGAQLGVLLSFFFWTYGLFQILSRWLVDRLHVGWVMAVGFFLWSAATSVTGLVHGFTALLVVRIVLGIGESVAYPSYSKILAKYIPDAQRGFANAVLASGLAFGPAFGSCPRPHRSFSLGLCDRCGIFLHRCAELGFCCGKDRAGAMGTATGGSGRESGGRDGEKQSHNHDPVSAWVICQFEG